ncbi:hypothetical protein PG995_013331 [Apiospora arundinis]
MTKLPVELWYMILSILTTPSPLSILSAWLRRHEDRENMEAVWSLSQTCRDLRSICSPWWYQQVSERNMWDPGDPFNSLLVNATSHGNIDVLRQAVDAGFTPGHPRDGIFRFLLDSTGRLRPVHPGVTSSTQYRGNLAQVSILGVAGPNQKLALLRWLFNLEGPLANWAIQQDDNPTLLESAAETGELDVIEYLMGVFPPRSPFVDAPETLFDIALGNNAPNDTLEYFMGRLVSPDYADCQSWFRGVFDRKDFRGLRFLLAHDEALGICNENALRDIIGRALDAALFPERQSKICSHSIEIIDIVLRWGLKRWPRGRERHIHYNIPNFTEALRWGHPRKRRMLLHIVKRLTQDYRVTWTQATEAGDEPWSFAFLENCGCGRRSQEAAWLKLFKLLYRRTPQNVCRASESRYGPEDRAGPLRLVADLEFSDFFTGFGFCRCRRQILELLLARDEIDINEGRDTALGTVLHTFCENVFRLHSRGYFEGGPHPIVRSYWDMFPFLTFLAIKGCDVAATDNEGRTARDWLREGEERIRGEGWEAWAFMRESGRSDLSDFMEMAILHWPVNGATRGDWDFKGILAYPNPKRRSAPA